MYETSVVQRGTGWLTDRSETPVCVCVFITPQALPAYLTACSHEEATWTRTSTACCQHKQGVGLIQCNTFPLCGLALPLIVACSITILGLLTGW